MVWSTKDKTIERQNEFNISTKWNGVEQDDNTARIKSNKMRTEGAKKAYLKQSNCRMSYCFIWIDGKCTLLLKGRIKKTGAFCKNSHIRLAIWCIYRPVLGDAGDTTKKLSRTHCGEKKNLWRTWSSFMSIATLVWLFHFLFNRQCIFYVFFCFKRFSAHPFLYCNWSNNNKKRCIHNEKKTPIKLNPVKFMLLLLFFFFCSFH